METPLLDELEKKASELSDIEAEMIANDMFRRRFRWDKKLGEGVLKRPLSRDEKRNLLLLARDEIHPSQYIPFVRLLSPTMRRGGAQRLAPKIKSYISVLEEARKAPGIPDGTGPYGRGAGPGGGRADWSGLMG